MVGSDTKRNAFDIKWYEVSALAHWVREKPVPAARFEYDKIIEDHQDEILDQAEKYIDAQRSMDITMFEWGWVIETCHVDENHTVTLETLVSYDGYTATITNRTRFGPEHNEMQPYPRDDYLPIPSIVRLWPCPE